MDERGSDSKNTRLLSETLFLEFAGRKIYTSQFGNLRKERASVQASSIIVDYYIAKYVFQVCIPLILVKLPCALNLGPFLAPFAKSNANANTILLNAGQELHMKIPNPAATTANKPPAVSTRSAPAAPEEVLLAAAPVAVLLLEPLAKPLAALDSTAVELATLLPLLVLLATMSVVVPYACAASHCCVFSCWTPNKPGSLGQLL